MMVDGRRIKNKQIIATNSFMCVITIFNLQAIQFGGKYAIHTVDKVQY